MSSKLQKMLSVTQVAQKLGITRTHVLRKIKKGEINAHKVGKSYIIDESNLPSVHRPLSERDKQQIDKAVQRALKEYGDAIRKLGDA